MGGSRILSVHSEGGFGDNVLVLRAVSSVLREGEGNTM